MEIHCPSGPVFHWQGTRNRLDANTKSGAHLGDNHRFSEKQNSKQSERQTGSASEPSLRRPARKIMYEQFSQVLFHLLAFRLMAFKLLFAHFLVSFLSSVVCREECTHVMFNLTRSCGHLEISVYHWWFLDERVHCGVWNETMLVLFTKMSYTMIRTWYDWNAASLCAYDFRLTPWLQLGRRQSCLLSHAVFIWVASGHWWRVIAKYSTFIEWTSVQRWCCVRVFLYIRLSCWITLQQQSS